MIFLNLIIGAIEGRIWGGWFHPNGLVKRLMVFLTAFGLSYLTYQDLQYSLFAAGMVLLLILNPLHGEGMNYEANPLWKNALIMGGSYGLMAAAGLAGYAYFTHDYLIILRAVPLFFSWVFYWAAFKVYPKNKKFGEWPSGNFFLDGYTCLGEMGLRATIFACFC